MSPLLLDLRVGGSSPVGLILSVWFGVNRSMVPDVKQTSFAVDLLGGDWCFNLSFHVYYISLASL